MHRGAFCAARRGHAHGRLLVPVQSPADPTPRFSTRSSAASTASGTPFFVLARVHALLEPPPHVVHHFFGLIVVVPVVPAVRRVRASSPQTPSRRRPGRAGDAASHRTYRGSACPTPRVARSSWYMNSSERHAACSNCVGSRIISSRNGRSASPMRPEIRLTALTAACSACPWRLVASAHVDHAVAEPSFSGPCRVP